MTQGEQTRAAVTAHQGGPPDLGEPILERETPSSVPLVTPLVVRVTDFLADRCLVDDRERNRVAVCIEEGLRNAIVHGHREEFDRLVRLAVYEGDGTWSVRIEDGGDGFDPTAVPVPDEDEAVWGEGGRGMAMMRLYAERIDYFNGGRVLLLTFRRPS